MVTFTGVDLGDLAAILGALINLGIAVAQKLRKERVADRPDDSATGKAVQVSPTDLST
ncbi:hypothetical protein [Cryptosporangium arvum]|uniref:Uncharacterized protein n=1 Tax=Cryptosporangium arvum DSM 44712 TaxID=927661 RepID=A0A010YP74_9ACTN|nr:hypothetical protein [Cryptosporangium arvum]EXG81990.1 hypothetical protein CryarDRAFT_3117 [Cryptosporangium arvum DSM 44712]